MKRFWETRLTRHKVEDLRKRISEGADLVLFAEAVKCLKAQAYRAAYVMTWLCIAESLRNKFVEMSRRDSEVGQIVGRIRRAEQRNQATDRLLLENAAQLGMIAPDEGKKLANMLEMRHIYAHPTGAGPSEQEVLAALVIAVEAVLSRPPLLRHGYVASLVQSLFEDRHFLDDIPERVREYATAVVYRVHPNVLPYLFRKLAERLEPIIGDPELDMFGRRGLEFGTSLLTELRPDLSSEAWNILTIVQTHPAAAPMLLGIPELWHLLPDQVQDMVFGHLVQPVKEAQTVPPTAAGLQRAWNLSSAGLLTARHHERLRGCIDSAPLPILRETDVPLEEYAQRIIEELASHNWYRQNPACDVVREAGPEKCSQADEGTQEQLGRNVLQAADGTAAQAESFVEWITTEQQVWPRAFVEGLILETLVNDDGCFRLKERHFDKALEIAVKHPNTEMILQRVIGEVSRSEPTSLAILDDYDKALELIRDIRTQEESEIHPYPDALIDAIDSAKSRATAQALEELGLRNSTTQ